MLIIREAQEKDNEQLISMELKAPQGETIQLVTERKDYFYRAKKFKDPVLLVAEDDETGKILAIMGVGPLNMNLRGKNTKGGFIFDWRSNPEEIKGMQRPIFRLWQALTAHMEQLNLDFIFGYVKEDNIRSMKILTRAGTKVTGDKTFLTIPLHKKLSRNIENVKFSRKVNFASDYKKVKKVYGTHDLFPAKPDMQLLQNIYNKLVYGNFSYGNSSIKVWDNSAEFNFRVLNIPTLFKLARPFMNLLAPILPVPRVPGKGGTLKQWFLFDLLLDKEKDLPPIMEKIRLEAKKKGIDFLIYCQDNDQPVEYLEKISWLKVPYKVLFMPLNKGVPLPQNPTYHNPIFL